MDWPTILTIVGTNVAMITWLRSDMKSFETKIESKIDQFKDHVNSEMKDFHGRLCAIEERNRK